MDDWIEHHGKAKPEAEEGTIFDLKFRNGEEYHGGNNIPWWWLHKDNSYGYDIVAYRVHSTALPQQSE